MAERDAARQTIGELQASLGTLQASENAAREMVKSLETRLREAAGARRTEAEQIARYQSEEAERQSRMSEMQAELDTIRAGLADGSIPTGYPVG